MVRSNEIVLAIRDALVRAGIRKQDRILIAVSGGVDSIVLASALATIHDKKKLAIAHLDHKLRGKASDADAAFVKKIAASLGIEYFIECADVKAFAKQKAIGLEEAGRVLRYDFFRRLASEHEFRYIATAHHGDDRIETILMNIMRGTGLRGLAGIPRTRALSANATIIRPLLEVSKDSILTHARKNELRYREDKSNRSDEFTRNRIRKYVVPQLKQASAGQDIYTSVSRLVSSVEEINVLIAGEAQKLRKKALVKEAHPFFVELPSSSFRIELLRSAPSVICHELILRECGRISGNYFTIESSQWKRIQDIFSGVGAKKIQLSKQLFISRNKNILTIESSITVRLSEVLRMNGSVSTPIGEITLGRTRSKQIIRSTNDCVVSESLVRKHGLLVRQWNPADRMQPFGMNGTRLVSDMLSEAGVKTEALKRCFPLVVFADSPKTVLWIPGIRAAEQCRIEGGSETAALLSRKLK